MNEALTAFGLPVRVYQKQWDWFVKVATWPEQVFPFNPSGVIRLRLPFGEMPSIIGQEAGRN